MTNMLLYEPQQNPAEQSRQAEIVDFTSSASALSVAQQ